MAIDKALWSDAICAAYSLQSRAMRRVRSLSPNHTPGEVIDVIAVATPAASMASRDFCGLHPSTMSLKIRASLTMRSRSAARYFGGKM